jgi:chromosome segregation ATPase
MLLNLYARSKSKYEEAEQKLSRKAEEITEEREKYPTRIKEIILENFMSYEYARIPLKEGLNLIVGPNGAGKSSILLAISVALGQAYTERSRKLSDLIRRGKQIARVSLVFDNREKGGKRPIPYSKSDTFMLSRYLRKDGTYWFEADYREIDKAEVTRLLREFGINPDNILIIMHQGMIEELGSVSSQERLRLVEEAVGFSEYREKIQLAERELTSLVTEESSLLQLIDNANQALEYWKQVYQRYLEKKSLIEHRALLERELLWSQEAKITKALNQAREKVESRKRVLEEMIEERETLLKKAEEIHISLLDKQTEIKKLFFTLVRAEKERSENSSSAEVSKVILSDVESLLNYLTTLDISGKGFEERFEYIKSKLSGIISDSERKNSELNKEISSLQAEIAKSENLLKAIIEDYVSTRVRAEVLQFRIKNVESEIKELERNISQYEQELSELKPELEQAFPRIETSRQPYEISEEIKLVSAQIQKMQDIPEEAEKIYTTYAGNLEDLKRRLSQLQENKKTMLEELKKRKEVWRNAITSLVEEIQPYFQAVLSAADATGFIKLENEDDVEQAGLQLYVGFRGTAPTTLDPYTQSGGERSVALVAFVLSLQSKIISPIRAMDEFDIHMDPRNRETIFSMIISQMKKAGSSQYIVITPSLITVLDRNAHVITVQAVHGRSEVMELDTKTKG